MSEASTAETAGFAPSVGAGFVPSAGVGAGLVSTAGVGAGLASTASVGDYLALLKPRVMSLVVFTGLVGMAIAPGSLHPLLAAVAVLCIAAGAGASGAINMWYDRDIDAVMERTRTRPLPQGLIEPDDALAFGILLSAGAVGMMGLAVNWLAAGLLALTIAFYVFVYTIWLKRRTPQNIVIGGAAGAIPPVIGWAAVTGDLALTPLCLFAIVFVWTPPHFWALALTRSADYAAAGVPMLPVTAGAKETRRQIAIYSAVLAPLGLAPVLAGGLGWLYGAAAALLGLEFLRRALAVWRRADDASARSLFGFSLVYLAALFFAMLADRALGL